MTIPARFRGVVAHCREQVAIRQGADAVTYGQLLQRAERHRDALLCSGIRPGQIVLLRTSRSIETIAAMLGTLMAGGAYSVLAADHPALRRREMEDCLDIAEVIDAEYEPVPDPGFAGTDAERAPSSLAYVIFTSGSTGAPKAVGVPDEAVLRLLDDDRLGLVAGRRISHLSPIEFDASVLEVWGGLLSGMEVQVVSSQEVVNPTFMFDFISSHVDVMWLTCSLFNFLVGKRPAVFAHLDRVLVGGEALSLHHVNLALPHVTVVNGYGPTENTVFTTLDVMTTDTVDHIAIGTPVAGTQVVVLAADGREASEGELVALGTGLAVGYVNSPELTAEKFVSVRGERGYRTGDMVRVRPDGRLEFLGREDSQVKISGYRIDLGEVENAFLACGCATAKAWVEHDKILLAVTNAPTGVRAAAGDYLPHYMRPRRVVEVKQIPLTPNGKTDLAALKQLAETAPELAKELATTTLTTGPTPAFGSHDTEDSLGSQLKGLVAQRLGRTPEPGVDNLFALGLDSIALWRLVNEVNEQFGLALTIFDVLSDATLSGLHRAVSATQTVSTTR